MYEADKLSRCVQWARGRYFTSEFTLFASINFTEDMTAAEMKAVWSKACRYLSNKGVVALYTCEVSRRSNHFNFHMLLRSQTANLTTLLKFATKTAKTNIKVEPYDLGRGRLAVRYMTKAKTAKYKNGEIVSRDRWARKRVLLRQELKVRKYGTIGSFWPLGMNKETIWKEIVAHERKINDGLQQPGAEEYALELHELIGGYYPLNRVRRSVGLFGVPAGWVPKLDDDLVVVDDHDDEADVEPPAPAPPTDEPQEAVKPLRKAVEAPIMFGVGGSRLERPAAFYGLLLTTCSLTPDEMARPPPHLLIHVWPWGLPRSARQPINRGCIRLRVDEGVAALRRGGGGGREREAFRDGHEERDGGIGDGRTDVIHPPAGRDFRFCVFRSPI